MWKNRDMNFFMGVYYEERRRADAFSQVVASKVVKPLIRRGEGRNVPVVRKALSDFQERETRPEDAEDAMLWDLACLGCPLLCLVGDDIWRSQQRSILGILEWFWMNKPSPARAAWAETLTTWLACTFGGFRWADEDEGEDESFRELLAVGNSPRGRIRTFALLERSDCSLQKVTRNFEKLRSLHVRLREGRGNPATVVRQSLVVHAHLSGLLSVASAMAPDEGASLMIGGMIVWGPFQTLADDISGGGDRVAAEEFSTRSGLLLAAISVPYMIEELYHALIAEDYPLAGTMADDLEARLRGICRILPKPELGDASEEGRGE